MQFIKRYVGPFGIGAVLGWYVPDLWIGLLLTVTLIMLMEVSNDARDN